MKKSIILPVILALFLVCGIIYLLGPGELLSPDRAASPRPPEGDPMSTSSGLSESPPNFPAELPPPGLPEESSELPTPASTGDGSRDALASLHGLVVFEASDLVAGLNISLETELDDGSRARLVGMGLPEPAEQSLRVQAQTEDDGSYEFVDLLPLEYRIVVETEGLLLRRPFRQPFEVKLDPGEREELRIELARGYRIFGTVLDESGLPVEGAEVHFDGNLGRHLESCGGNVNWEGPCTVPVGPGGEYDTGPVLLVGQNIEEVLAPSAHAPGHETHRAPGAPAEEFVDGSLRMDFVLERASRLPTLRIRVVDSSGSPVVGARVRDRRGHLAFRDLETDALGELVIERLERRYYDLEVSREGYHPEGFELRLMDDTTREITLRSVQLAIEGTVHFEESIAGSMTHAGRLWLSRRDEAGQFRNLELEPAELERGRNFIFHLREPGRYRVHFSLGFRWAPGVSEQREFQSEPVLAREGEIVRAEVRVSLEAPFLGGQVIDGVSGEPVGGVPVLARIEFEPEGESGSEVLMTQNWTIDDLELPLPLSTPESQMDPNSAWVRTDERGRYLFLLPPISGGREGRRGKRTLWLHAGSGRTGGHSGVQGIEYDDSSEILDVNLEIHPPGSIEGSVSDGEGNSVASELVLAFDGLGVFAWSLSDGRGRYRLEKLRPGDYLVLALGSSNIPPLGGGLGVGHRAWRLPPPHEFFDFPLKVEVGSASSLDLRIDRDRLGSIEGRVEGDLGTDDFVRCGGLIDGELHESPPFGKIAAIAAGGFRLGRLFPGRYRVWVVRLEEGSERRLATQEVEVRRAKSAKLLLRLP